MGKAEGSAAPCVVTGAAGWLLSAPVAAGWGAAHPLASGPVWAPAPPPLTHCRRHCLPSVLQSNPRVFLAMGQQRGSRDTPCPPAPDLTLCTCALQLLQCLGFVEHPHGVVEPHGVQCLQQSPQAATCQLWREGTEQGSWPDRQGRQGHPSQALTS